MKQLFMWSLSNIFITVKTKLENWNYHIQKTNTKKQIFQSYDYLLVSEQLTFKMYNIPWNIYFHCNVACNIKMLPVLYDA